MPRKGEPEKVLGSDGQAVDDFERGIALRKANIDNVFTNENINFSSKNILFYDALQCYLGDGSLDLNYERSDIAGEREQIFTEINRIIIDREQQLTSELELLAAQFHQIASGDRLSKIEDAIVIDAAKKIGSFKDVELSRDRFSIDYVDMLPDHHCTLRATNNRYGQYELRGIDFLLISCKQLGEIESLNRSSLSSANQNNRKI
jgi:nitrous oxidase accessory protein NosD